MNDGKLSTSDLLGNSNRNQDAAVALEDEPVSDLAANNGDEARAVKASGPTPLFADRECNDFRSRWDDIQIHFVDDPRRAAQDADSLVAETMKRLAEIFSEERKNMEGQWSRGENVSTEALRLPCSDIASFFQSFVAGVRRAPRRQRSRTGSFGSRKEPAAVSLASGRNAERPGWYPLKLHPVNFLFQILPADFGGLLGFGGRLIRDLHLTRQLPSRDT